MENVTSKGMMMTAWNAYTTIIAITACCAFGCSVRPETIQSLQAAVGKSALPQTNKVDDSEVTRVKVTFEPSYPDRVDPFTYPNDSTLQPSEIDTSIKSAAHVDVLGFANLGSPRVFLRARDKTHSLSEGDTIYGVEVIEIRPPAVRLRMGSLMWTATMFDKNAGDRHP